MSTGEKIPLKKADQVADQVLAMLQGHGLSVVGSVRRRRPLVGDIEFIAPFGFCGDELHDAIMLQLDTSEPSIFNTSEFRAFRLIKGMAKRKEWRMAVLAANPEVFGVATTVTIYRYDRGSRGLIEILRTGPERFCDQVFDEWRKIRDEMRRFESTFPIMRDDCLVDMYGKPMNIATERGVFELIRCSYIPPENRDAMVERQ